MKISFYKYQGAGNDFVMLDERESFYHLSTSQIAHLCHRHFGIGADGLIRLRLDNLSDFRMQYYNSDGNESTMCGNGGRCIVAFARDLGMVKHQAEFLAIDGKHQATIEENIVNLQMQNVEEYERGENYFVIDTGSPHYVERVEFLDNFPVVEKAREIRYSEKFQREGINVNFVQLLGDNHLSVRTYERGVEDETLACGTGVVASALSYAFVENLQDFTIKVVALGGKLEVSAQKAIEGYKNIWLKGPAKKVFQGTIDI